MKKYYLLLTFLILSSCLINASKNSSIIQNKNQYFPLLFGIDLNGKNYNIPNDLAGNLNIIALAFERDHQKIVDSWIDEINIIINSNKNTLINFYEIPLIYEVNIFKRYWINNGMRFGIRNEEARKRTITVYTNREKFLEIMNMNNNEVYILLLDNAGKILWQCQGVINNKNLNSLKKFIKEYKTI